MKARLILEDGTVFVGKSFGTERDTIGEVVFHTGMTGYQEVLSDPSSCGQIVTMTYPLQGNYGINRDDFEAVRPYIHGFVAREHCEYPSNFRSQQTLDSLLKEYDIPGISEIDTRMLTRRLRQFGTMQGMITTRLVSAEEIITQMKSTPKVTDQVSIVSTNQTYCIPGRGARIVLLDFGVKRRILRELSNRQCDVTVVPFNTTAEEIKKMRPDGILLSNGPGNPEDLTDVVETIKQIILNFPLFGIGLGHQLFAMACGAKIEKMKVGRHGSNYPVKEIVSDRVRITSQGNSYIVPSASIVETELELTHIGINDGSVEGLQHRDLSAFSVQFYPEAAPGPYDSSDLFDQFLNNMKQYKKGGHAYAITR